MNIELHCPHCQKQHIAPDSWIGRTARCDACGQRFILTLPEAGRTLEKADAESQQSRPIANTAVLRARRIENDLRGQQPTRDEPCPEKAVLAESGTTSPVERLVSTKKESATTVPPPLRVDETRSFGQQMDLRTKIAVSAAGLGLLLLAMSPFFKWISFGSGGMIGLAGDGKIILGITLLAICFSIASFVKQKWLTPVLLSVQAWGTVVVFWMGGIIWKAGSILNSPEISENPLAGLIAIQVSPGAGLYLGLIGAMLVAGAVGFIIVQRLLISGTIKHYYATQGMSCVIGMVVVFIVGPGIRPGAGPQSANTIAGTVSSSAEKKEDMLKQRTIKLGQTITLQSLAITPEKVEFAKVKGSVFGSEREVGPYLVLTCRLKNIAEGQVFSPSFAITGTDNYGNQLVGLTYIVCEGSHTDDIQPGQDVPFISCVERKLDTAVSYVWDISARVNNKPADNMESWRLEFNADEIQDIPQTSQMSVPATEDPQQEPKPVVKDPQQAWRDKHHVSPAQWDEMIANFIGHTFPESVTESQWWQEAEDKTPAQLNEAYPSLKPREWYRAAWFSGFDGSRRLDSVSSGRYWLNMSLDIRTEPNLVIKEIYGTLTILQGKKVIYEALIVEKPDLSFKDNCHLLHTIDPYDDTNEAHRTLRYAKDNELIPVFTVSKVVLADGTERTFEDQP